MVRKRPELDNLYAKTEQDPPESDSIIPSEGRTITTGVGLKESELALLDKIAIETGVARNALLRWLLRYALQDYLAGKINLSAELEIVQTRRLRMP